MASIGHLDVTDPANPQWVHHCGASIVTKKHLLTAAHCLNSANAHQVLLGVNGLWNHKNGTILEVVKENGHPRYVKNRSYHFDVAVLTVNETIQNGLIRPIQNGPNINPVCMSKTPVDNVNQHADKLTTLTGWGGTSQKHLETSFGLMQFQLYVYQTGYCNCCCFKRCCFKRCHFKCCCIKCCRF
jgi:V8-like Glu-specific endopeptidase